MVCYFISMHIFHSLTDADRLNIISFAQSVMLRSMWTSQLLFPSLKIILFYTIVQLLRCSPYVPTTALALVCVYDQAFLRER